MIGHREQWLAPPCNLFAEGAGCMGKGMQGGRTQSAHKERQWPLSGVHSIMMEKSAQPWWGWGVQPTHFHYNYHHGQSCSVSSSWEGRYNPPISTLPLFVLCWGGGRLEGAVETGGCTKVLSRKLHSPENRNGVIFLYEHLPSLFISHGTLNVNGDGVRKSSTEPEVLNV